MLPTKLPRGKPKILSKKMAFFLPRGSEDLRPPYPRVRSGRSFFHAFPYLKKGHNFEFQAKKSKARPKASVPRGEKKSHFFA